MALFGMETSNWVLVKLLSSNGRARLKRATSVEQLRCTLLVDSVVAPMGGHSSCPFPHHMDVISPQVMLCKAVLRSE